MTQISEELRQTLAAIPTPAVANGLERFDIRPRDEGFMDGSIHCRFPALGPMVGYAVTAKLIGHAEDDDRPDLRERLWEHTQEVPGPRIVVIEDLDNGVGSFWGEVNANVFHALGCLGVITNGGVRDLPEMEAVGFHAFSGQLSVSHAYNKIVEVGGPVTVGGLVVNPGDLLHADEHGVVQIPAEVAAEVPQAVRDVEEIEQRTISLVKSADFSLEKLLESRRVVTH